MLVTRLRSIARRAARGGAAAAPIVAPLIGTGLPRTGTTFLHGLLSCDPAHRSVRAWEAARVTFADLPAGHLAYRAASTAVAAGVMRVGRVGALDHAEGDTMWRIHVEAATRLADVLVPPMAQRGRGRVVLLGSRVAHGMPGRAQYAATKAALVALARSWASEVVAKGVTINVVAPAAAGTPMLEDSARVASAPRVPPLGRLIDPAEIAEFVAYLLSPAAAAISS